MSAAAFTDASGAGAAPDVSRETELAPPKRRRSLAASSKAARKARAVRRRMLAAGAAAALLVLAARGASAHGAAAWIEHEPAYRAPNGAHCCGAHDCARMPADMKARLRPVHKGWALDGQTFTYGARGLYSSVDSDWWVCIWGGEVKCIFEPQDLF